MMKFAVVTAFLSIGTLLSTTANALSPSVVYTEEQQRVCSPHPESDSDFVEDKANFNAKTIWAKSVISAPKGRVFDPRDEAVAFSSGTINWGQNGKPVVIERLNGVFVKKIELATKDHRGGPSHRTGRSMEARNHLIGMTVLATPECYTALGLFEAS